MASPIDQLKKRCEGLSRYLIVKNVLEFILERYKYTSDKTSQGIKEHWAVWKESIIADGLMEGDCEDIVECVLRILWGVFGISQKDLAIVITDVNRKDDQEYDHCVGAVKIGNNWYYFQCWDAQLHKDFIRGQETVGYRKLNQKDYTPGEPE